MGPTSGSTAAASAAANFAANLAALAKTQPRLVEAGAALPALEFVFGRDGYLTAFDGEGRWWSGCSLPKRANAAMLRSLKVTGPVSCLLAPPHAASVRVALDMTGASHAIVAADPDPDALLVLLACDDFSAEIGRHRLWFASGSRWVGDLEKLFDEQPGLPTPSQFIRLPVTEQATIDLMIKAAQGVFSSASARRSLVTREMRDAWRPGGGRKSRGLCVLTTRQFSLWKDAAFALGAVLGRGGIVPVYLDEPLHGSPHALLSAAVDCEAMVTADVARADMTDLLPRELPWVAWLTTPRIPAYAAAGPRDALLVADASWKRAAEDAGWPASRVELARWPDLPDSWTDEPYGSIDLPCPRQNAAALAIISDTFPLDPPDSLDDFSSQRLLWNSIRKELESDPLLLAGADPGACLDQRLEQLGVSGQGLDRGLFLDRLIIPCHAQGIARLLMGAQLPLRLFGSGWGDLAEFAPHAAGPILSRPALARAAASAAALVHVWPAPWAHPIEAAGRPVVRPAGRRADVLIRDAMIALSSGPRENTIGRRRRGDQLGLQQVLSVTRS